LISQGRAAFCDRITFHIFTFPNALNHFHDELASGYGSKAKIFVQSSFMLMTVHAFFFASAISASLNVNS
jgi:hypothetical protein